MKVWFTHYGFRETKTWDCPHCRNFSACGMDLSVDESRERHLKGCAKSRGLSRIFAEASQRQTLKDLVWLIYENPDKVKQAIEALKKIAEGM